jgi:hypothetical protein
MHHFVFFLLEKKMNTLKETIIMFGVVESFKFVQAAEQNFRSLANSINMACKAFSVLDRDKLS